MQKKINVQSGFGHRTQQPFVILRLGDEFAQMPTAQARNIALWLLEAADAAESDGFLMSFMARMDLDEQQSAGLLQQFREYRDTLKAGQ